MRVISQDGTIDVPYEHYTIWCCKDQYLDVYHIACDCGDEAYRRLAKYSTEAKAIKAMEMLREQYARIEIIKTLANGTCKYMEESLEPKEFKDILKEYINMEVFQFPQDDEIEV